MAKVITDVLLKDGVDETTFINDVTSNDEVDLKDSLSVTLYLVLSLSVVSYFFSLNCLLLKFVVS